ncbi:MAG: FtsX-like permease family protein [Candidatus Yonathbacteria bacterium]|nr:FtsX-like permease family protein [Candidatus Yonathbacteria bacterium]NTW47805.1 FtsX-like permease family protein [Candidatus Yonathbacteria bacterium]
MILLRTIKTSWTALLINKARSLLTILGIVIGVAAIILIMAIGQGAQDLILGEIGGLGADTVIVRPGKQPTGPSDSANMLFSDSLKERELDALRKKSNVPTLKSAEPAVLVPATVSYKGETYRPEILGWSADNMSNILDIHIEQGTSFGEREDRQKENVAVIGDKVRTELFDNEDPLGKNIRIKDKNFRVIGVFPPSGQALFVDVDELVLVPPSTALTYLLGSDHYNEIIVQAESSDVVDQTVLDIERTLRDMHDITDPKDDDFFVQTQKELLSMVGTILSVLTAFLASMVAISLVVGGIGVMNIMLVSVSERTREIGLRKAVGATNVDIRRQFLIEAIVLTGIGGVIGTLIGFALSALAAVILSQVLGVAWGISFPVGAALLGIGASAAVGLVFGSYPARKASEKSPIEALRYE